MALRRFRSVAPTFAFTRATAGTSTQPDVFSWDIIAEIRGLEYRMDAKMKQMDSKIESEMREMKSEMKKMDSKIQSEMKEMETRIRGLYEGRFRSSERVIYASIAAGFVALGVVYEGRRHEEKARHLVELKAVESLTASRTCQALVSGAMSGEVFTENVKRSANERIPAIAAAEH